MNFDWSDFLDIAFILADEAPSYTKQEAIERTAISRVYYAAFKKAEEFLLQKNEIKLLSDYASSEGEEQKSSHWRVIRVFTSSRNPTRKTIGEKLRRLKFNRESADYFNPFRGDIEVYLNDSLDLAQEIVNALNIAV